MKALTYALCGLVFALLPLAASAQGPGPAPALSPEIVKLLKEIKAADRDLLAVSEEDGRFLRVTAVASGAQRALEIGGASGYSAIWIGLALRETGGRLTTIEFDPMRAAIASTNIRRAGLADIVTVVPGDAFKEIPRVAGDFDFVFLDAWKRDYKRFLDLVFPRLQPRGLFLAHNVVNKETEMRDFLAAIQNNPALLTTIVKPSDEGMSVSVKVHVQSRCFVIFVLSMRSVHIIGVPLDLGSGRRGVDMGPSAFRIAGVGERLVTLGCSVVDRGDLQTPIPETQERRDEHKKYVHDIARVCERLYETSLVSLDEGALPIVLGGDHSLAAGSVGAAAQWARTGRKLPIGLIWIDAHGDMNTPATSPSGNVHGMPLAALLGPEPPELAQIGGWSPKVLPAHTVLLGVRNLDEREKTAVRGSGVHVFTMNDIDRHGIASIAERAASLAGTGTAGIHVSFDLDACDPMIAPGVGTPVRGGLNYREAHMVMEIVAESGLLTSLDMVEVNPTLDMQNATAQLGTELILSALGMKIL